MDSTFYDLLDVDNAGEAVALERVTTLGATKSDIATMVWWMLEAPATAPATGSTPVPEADNCLLLRMIALARNHRYRVARTAMPGLYVDSKELKGLSDPETAQCSCNSPASTQPFCHISLAQVCMCM